MLRSFLVSVVVFAGIGTGLAAPQAVLGPDDTLRMGCVAFAKEATAQSYRLIRDYLAEGTKRDVKMTVYPTYHEVVHDMVNDNLEVAVLSPLVYLTARGDCNLDTIGYGIYRSSGDFTYKSVIYVPRTAEARKLADLAGKRMAYVDIMSVSGYVLPKAALSDAGLTGPRKVVAQFFGNHVDAVQAVLTGQADAVATYDIVFDDAPALRGSRKNLRLLWTSDFVIPSDAVVTTRRVPTDVRHRLRSLLLSYFAAQESKQVPTNRLYEGFVPGDPNLYRDLARFMTEVKAKKR